MNPTDLFFYDKIPYQTDDFKLVFAEKVINIAKNLGCSPDHFLMVCYFEAKLKPSYVNRNGTAVGMIPIVASQAVRLGTTVKELQVMGGIEQLDYIERYLKPRCTEPVNTLVEIYLAVFYPAAVGKPLNFKLRIANRWREAYRHLNLTASVDVRKIDLEIALTKYFMNNHGWNE